MSESSDIPQHAIDPDAYKFDAIIAQVHPGLRTRCGNVLAGGECGRARLYRTGHILTGTQYAVLYNCHHAGMTPANIADYLAENLPEEHMPGDAIVEALYCFTSDYEPDTGLATMDGNFIPGLPEAQDNDDAPII